MAMDLSSTYHFKDWDIKYTLAISNDSRESEPRQLKPVVFVHGTPWSSAVFRPVIEALLARGPYQILVYDLPGYGQSQTYNPSSETRTSGQSFEGDTSVRFQAEALAGLLEHTQLDGKDGHPTPAVIAHDIAGTIVLRAHLLHDCDFASMMLCETNTVLPWGDGFYKLCRSEAQTFLRLPPAIFEAVVRAVTKSAVHNPKLLQSGWDDILAEPWIGSVESQRSFVRQIAQANDADVAEMLEGNLYGRVRCDVKILWAEQDQWIPRGKIDDMAARLGDRAKEMVIVPEAGHLVMLDQPERFAIEDVPLTIKAGRRLERPWAKCAFLVMAVAAALAPCDSCSHASYILASAATSPMSTPGLRRAPKLLFIGTVSYCKREPCHLKPRLQCTGAGRLSARKGRLLHVPVGGGAPDARKVRKLVPVFERHQRTLVCLENELDVAQWEDSTAARLGVFAPDAATFETKTRVVTERTPERGVRCWAWRSSTADEQSRVPSVGGSPQTEDVPVLWLEHP
ncbi:hypothetical protein LTR53_000940 [Teratosphaeriaceae sp. CCFEE 6253]|nr:hypothetical protein LTR53_000940 [Teratosphaeriaceae sp. CCFEE 6253]